MRDSLGGDMPQRPLLEASASSTLARKNRLRPTFGDRTRATILVLLLSIR